MRRLAANYVFPVVSPPVKNGIIEISDDGEIMNVIDPGPDFKEFRKVEFFNGVLVPGFINCHNHIELSALKDSVEPGLGLFSFIKSIRKAKKELKIAKQTEAIKMADEEMQRNGIVACGDISNTDISFQLKQDSKIYYHTFVEVFGPTRKKAKKNLKKALQIHNKLVNKYKLNGNLTPHAFYSVHPSLMESKFINSASERCVYSIHNQESGQLTEQRIKGKLKFYYRLKNLEFHKTIFQKEATTKAKDNFRMFSGNSKILLVHNIYTQPDDIVIAADYFRDLYWVFCPNSNLYIENQLPDLNAFIDKHQNIALGTDSLASNNGLSLLNEMKTIQKNFSRITMDNLFIWGTLNGAKALGIDRIAGSFEIGKKPGVNLVSNVDFKNWTLPESATLKTII